MGQLRPRTLPEKATAPSPQGRAARTGSAVRRSAECTLLLTNKVMEQHLSAMVHLWVQVCRGEGCKSCIAITS